MNSLSVVKVTPPNAHAGDNFMFVKKKIQIKNRKNRWLVKDLLPPRDDVPTFYWLLDEGLQKEAEGGGSRAGGDGVRWAGEHRAAAVASEAEIGFSLSSARQSPSSELPVKMTDRRRGGW